MISWDRVPEHSEGSLKFGYDPVSTIYFPESLSNYHQYSFSLSSVQLVPLVSKMKVTGRNANIGRFVNKGNKKINRRIRTAGTSTGREVQLRTCQKLLQQYYLA